MCLHNIMCFSEYSGNISDTGSDKSIMTLGQREINCELVKTTKGNTFSTRMVLPAQAGEFVDLQHLLSQMLKYNRSQIHHVSHLVTAISPAWWVPCPRRGD